MGLTLSLLLVVVFLAVATMTQRVKLLLAGILLLAVFFVVGAMQKRLVFQSASVSAEAVKQVGVWTAVADCPPSSAEGQMPSPCTLTRLATDGTSGVNTAFAATLYNATLDNKELVLAQCQMDRADRTRSLYCPDMRYESFRQATDQRNVGIDLTRITEVKFVRPGTGEVVATVPVEQLGR